MLYGDENRSMQIEYTFAEHIEGWKVNQPPHGVREDATAEMGTAHRTRGRADDKIM